MRLSSAEKKAAKQGSWLSCFGVPSNKTEAQDEAVPKTPETPKTKRIGRSKEFDQDHKKQLREHIRAAIESGIANYRDIWAHTELSEEETGKQIFLRSKSDGKLMSVKTFRDYVNKVKHDISFKPPISKKELVVQSFLSGKRDNQISREHGISLGYINRILVLAGHRKSNAKWYREFLFKELEKTNDEPTSTGSI